MKKQVNLILSIILALALNACSANMDDSEDFNFDDFFAKWGNYCPSITDAVKKPEHWNVDVERTFVIPDGTIRSMSTCGLLDTYLTFPSHPDPNGGNFYNPAITEFNANLRKNKVAVELFKRSDCFPVLAAKYLTSIKEIKPPDNKYGPYDKIWKEVDDLEWLLASDMCMAVLNVKEKKQLMAIALVFEEKSRVNVQCMLNTYNIMITIMINCNYQPFVKEVGPRIREGAAGYYLIEGEGLNVIIGSDIDLILKYANKFLNEQK